MICRVTVLDNGSLRISNVTRLDDGLYTCVARNQFGVASSAGSLLVKGKLDLIKLFSFFRAFVSSPVAAKDVAYNQEGRRDVSEIIRSVEGTRQRHNQPFI